MSMLAKRQLPRPIAWLVRPNAKLPPDRQNQAQLFLIFFLFYIVYAIAYTGWNVYVALRLGDVDIARADVLGTTLTLIPNLVFFAIARTRFYRAGIVAAYLFYNMTLFLTYAAPPVQPQLVTLTVIPVLASAFMFGPWITVGVAVVQVALPLFGVVVGGIPLLTSDTLASLPNVLLISGVAVISSAVGAAREARDRAALEDRNRMLAAARASLEEQVAAQTETLRVRNRELEDRRKHLQALYDQAADAFFLLDLNDTILEVNQQACASLGYTSDELVGMRYAQIEASLSDTSSLSSAVESGQLLEVESTLKRKDSSAFPVEIRATLLDLDNGKRVFAVARDVTEQRRVASRLRLLTQKLVVAQEEERSHLAGSLHDEAGQSLTALRYGLAMAYDSASAEAPNLERVRSQLQRALSQTDKASEEIRRMARTLRPVALEDVGLASAISGLCLEFDATTPMFINYHGTTVPDVPVLAAVTAYRVVQESLTNAVRHSGAATIDVHVEMADDALRITVEDDGVGYRHEETSDENGSGMGLANMTERLRLVDGTLDIETRTNGGTRLTAMIPCTQ